MTQVTVELSDILSYISFRQRPLIEGESVFKAGHVILCQLKAIQTMEIFALVLKTSGLTSPPHQVGLNLAEDPQQWHCVCSCKSGQSGFCKHVVATLIYINRFGTLELLSCTDQPQQWGKEKEAVRFMYEGTKLTEFCHPENKTKRIKWDSNLDVEQTNLNILLNVDGSALQLFKARAKKLEIRQLNVPHNKSADDAIRLYSLIFYWGTIKPLQLMILKTTLFDCSVCCFLFVCFRKNESSTYDKIIANIQQSQFLESCELKVEDYALKVCCKNVLKNIKDVDFRSALNVKQNSQEWVKLRQLRITGSRCYEIYTYQKGDWENKAMRYFWPKSFFNKYIKHGKEHEKNALAVYMQKNPTTEVHNLGFIISEKFPWIGYSPDGVIFERGVPTKLLEIKCPFAGKEQTELQTITSCKFLKNNNGVLSLKEKHAYYAQIQLGMAVLNLPKTDFLIYSSCSSNYVVITVDFNPNYAKLLLTKTTENYFKFMLHVYCENKVS